MNEQEFEEIERFRVFPEGEPPQDEDEEGREDVPLLFPAANRAREKGAGESLDESN